MQRDHAPAGIDRRGFLKLGLGGSAALALLGGGAQLAGCSAQTAAPAAGMRWLTAADLPFARALLMAVAGPALPADAQAARAIVDEGLRRADLALDALGAPAQKQLRQLFDLVQWSPFRRLAGGVSRPWAEADASDAATLLTHFRDSRLTLLNGAYRALVKLGSTVVWSQPATFPASHYPGPPAWAVAALNA
ncbi:hypothetical protein [Solimonas soli]|uniref:hypothetical protein n=1 Tax=Solimonas soli TaxID=413479 RepID=UPI000487D657|nr:hypothetical protein [Solimonas soli]